MPNGISCAYFALKNLKIGRSNKDVFREGIAGCQAVRTVDKFVNPQTAKAASDAVNSSSKIAKAASEAANSSKTAKGLIKNSAAFAEKIVYPLIIASGVYNTVRAEDKVKTGAMQASAIATMFTFETVAKKCLEKISNRLLNIPFVKSHKAAKIGIYVAKGLAFVAASLAGYDIGSNGAENIVNKKRAKKNNNPEANEKTKSPDEMDNVLNEFVFSDMKL